MFLMQYLQFISMLRPYEYTLVYVADDSQPFETSVVSKLHWASGRTTGYTIV